MPTEMDDVDSGKTREQLVEELRSLRAEAAALRDRCALLDATIELIPDAVYAKDLDGRYILVNSASAVAFGRSAADALGKDDTELFSPDSAQIIMETDRRIIAEGATITFELTASAAQSMRTYLTTKGPFTDDRGRVVGILGYSRDITEQRQAEQAIERSRRRFRAIFENALDGMLLFDDAGAFVDGNPAILQLLGYSREELLQMAITDVTPGLERERVPELMHQFLSIGALIGEYTFLCKDGSLQDVEYRAVANILPGLHLGIQRDITERKRAEQELQNHHNLLHAVIEGIPDAIYVKDVEGRTLMINSYGARRVGKTVAELIGCDNSIFFSPETAQRIRATDRQVMETGQSITLEDLFTAAGVTRTLLTTKAPFRNASGEVIGLLGISRDITESKALQTERDRLLERLRLQIDRLPLAYLLLDEQHRIIDWNPAAETMFGYTKAEALAQRTFDLIVPKPLDSLLAEVIRRVESGDMHASSVNENLTKDGRVITCHWFNTPLMDPDGNFAGVICVVQDITERRRAEEESRILNAALENAVDGIGRVDAEGRYSVVNRAFADILGFRAEELVGTHWLSTIHPTDVEKAEAAYERMLKDGKAEVELHGLRKDGSVFWRQTVMVKAHNHQPEWVGHYSLHERHQRAQAVRRSLAQLGRTIAGAFPPRRRGSGAGATAHCP